MLTVRVNLRNANMIVPPLEADGLVPYAESPLAVTKYSHWDESERKWTIGHEWQITHRRTGKTIGTWIWDRAEDAMAVLEACDPRFGAWDVVQADVIDAAMLACRYKFRAALEAIGAVDG